MQPDVLQLKDQLLALPAVTRSLLVDVLTESLRDKALEDDPTFLAELERRTREIDEGKVECIPADEVIASMYAALE